MGWLTINLVAQMALGLLAMTMCLPSMQDWPATFGASQAQVQLTFGAFIAAYGGFQLVHGPLSDRIGRKPVLLAGLLLCVAGSLLCALADELWMLVLGRVVQGAGGAAGMVVGRAMVQDLFVGPGRTRMMAFVGMTMGVCPPVAMLVGGQLHVRLGWQAGFVLVALLAALLFAAAWRGLPAREAAAAGAAQSGSAGWGALLSGYLRLLRHPVFMMYVAMLGSTTATFYAFLGGAPLVLARYDVTPERIGLYIMTIPVSYIAGNLLTTRLIRRHGDRSLMRMGQVLSFTGLGLVLGLALAGVQSPLALSLPLLFLGIGHGLLVPPVLAGTVGTLPALAGSAAAVAGLMQQLTGALGGFSVGLMPHGQGATNLALTMLGWTAVGLVAQMLMFRATRRTTTR
jgi:DHA1 family bicyclomycin/chloramphenicol resistance-like MFS transporter